MCIRDRLVDDEVIDFANREMHNVVMSLDGRKEVHDRLRKNYAGQGSYCLLYTSSMQVPAAQRLRTGFPCCTVCILALLHATAGM